MWVEAQVQTRLFTGKTPFDRRLLKIPLGLPNANLMPERVETVNPAFQALSRENG